MRNFNEMSPITMCFASKTSPLIKIDVDRNISYYNSEGEKLSALRQAKDTDKFIVIIFKHLNQSCLIIMISLIC